MSHEPNKNPLRAERAPLTYIELTSIFVLLGLFLWALSVIVNSWLGVPVPDSAPHPKPAAPAVALAKPPASPPAALAKPPASPPAAERPSRDRPDALRERPWRDPSSASLPNF